MRVTDFPMLVVLARLPKGHFGSYEEPFSARVPSVEDRCAIVSSKLVGSLNS